VLSEDKHQCRSDQTGYREIPLSILKINERYEFDISFRIKEDYRLFAAKGACFTEAHGKILSSGDTRLYVHADDWGKVEECKVRLLSSILTDPKVSTKEKADIAYTTSMASIRKVFDETEARTIRHVEQNADEMVKLILSDGEVMNDLVWIKGHDHFTYQHSVKVGIYATALSLKLFASKLTRQELMSLSAGYFLHDIGMAQVPQNILDKRTPLNKEEWDIIRMHPLWGYDRLLEAGHLTPEAAAIVLSHHERHDGSGYPFNREGEGIPVYAKLCSIADVFEALTATRPYRKPKDPFQALKLMQQEMSKDFDAEIFKAFVMMLGPSL